MKTGAAAGGIHGRVTPEARRMALEFRVWRQLQLADEYTTQEDIGCAQGCSRMQVSRVMARRGWRLPRCNLVHDRRGGRPDLARARGEVPDVVDLMGRE